MEAMMEAMMEEMIEEMMEGCEHHAEQTLLSTEKL